MKLEHELVQTLANVKEVHGVFWDSLGQSIAVELTLGGESGPSTKCVVTLTPLAAAQLLPELHEALADKDHEGWTAQ